MRILRFPRPARRACAALAVAVAVTAQAPAPADPAAALAEAREICGEDPQSGLCRVLQEQIADFTAQSLLVVGASGQRAAAVETVRDFADWPQPMVRYAAATALGGLHPAAEDTPLLAALLNDPVPAVRAAARSSLGVSSDPVARRLVERAAARQGIAMVPDGPLVDPAALPVALPQGAEPVRFTSDAEAGVAAFVTDIGPEAILAELAAKVGAEPIDLDALAALYGRTAEAPPVDVNDPMAVMQYMLELQQRIDALPEDEQEDAYAAAMMELAVASGQIEQDTGHLDRWRDSGLYGAPMAVVLPADPAVPLPFPSRIAVVYRDVTLDRTGFALQWVPAAAMPPPPEPEPDAEQQQASAPTSTIFGLQSTPADRLTPAEVEAMVWEAVLFSEDPAAAQLFIDTFPESEHAEEAVRLRDTWPPLPSADAETTQATGSGPDAEPAEPAQSSLFGTPAVDPAAASVPALEADKDAFAVGETIGVRWSGMPGDRNEWITVVPVETPDSTWGDWAYTDHSPTGRLTLAGQDEPGDYEIRAYLEWPREVVARIPITVTP